jgi:iron complex outermembrane recepter protein
MFFRSSSASRRCAPRPSLAAALALMCTAGAPLASAIGPTDSPLAVRDAQTARRAVPQDALDEIVVTATLRREPQRSMPGSLTLLDRGVLERAAPRHFEDAIALVPNLNWASGTSRPRYFQVRGIGETEQWQGAPNPSVGFLIDGMDFSGVAAIATMLDVERIEVLRGPQGTAFGANALAGLVSIRSEAPQRERTLDTEVSVGDFDERSLSLVVGGAAGSDGAWRFAARGHRADGFVRNVFLGRDDTNRIAEDVARVRWSHRPESGPAVDLVGLWVEQDNGYDTFTLDNTRNSRADKPGEDAQRARGLSATVEWPLAPQLRVEGVSAWTQSRSAYGYDGDWTFAPDYDFTQAFARERQMVSQDLRLVAPAWIVGAYVSELREDGAQTDRFGGMLLREPLQSRYRASNVAAYGQAERAVAAGWLAALGVRAEQRSARYRDSDAADDAPRDRMLGGHVSLRFTSREATTLWLTAARGYKAGGFNIGALVPADRLRFDPEFLHSLELGLRHASADQRWSGSVSAFSMWRRNQQVSTSVQIDPGDPLSFLFLTDNAARGRNRGVEWELRWMLSPSFRVDASGAWLSTRYDGYRVTSGRSLDGRAQTHAPARQLSAALEYRAPSGAFVRVDAAHRASFYFGDSHDARSRPYTLVGARAGFERGPWSASLWVRNALDASWSQRGYYFGNEPPDFPDRLYLQPGDPRQIGVTIRWQAREQAGQPVR